MCAILIQYAWSPQSGRQAIHFAATYGQTEMLTSLIDNFGVDPQEKAEVLQDVFVFGDVASRIRTI